ncbi:uncharacterized protein LOC126788149 [Argentina anserina]|uniref:uncharacterized protein LOC126788149 n=1 Tax=Argentina anserina TaxID=57926 RepID=UPI002176828A|nr:uncharacterized protein LOC126788149 [Potentilla anserina]
MKKLYRRGTVHPSPPIVSDHLSFLPVTILALAAALSLEDREVLAYLISSSHLNTNNNNSLPSSPSSRKTTAANNRKSSAAKGGGGDHPARFNCSCFRCYTSYWARWDESPNRELIHEIIDAFEDGLPSSQSGSNTKAAGSKNGKKEKRHNNKRGGSSKGPGQGSDLNLKKKDHQLVKPNMVEESNSSSSTDSVDLDGDEESKGSVRKFVSFLGERIWGGIWNQ